MNEEIAIQTTTSPTSSYPKGITRVYSSDVDGPEPGAGHGTIEGELEMVHFQESNPAGDDKDVAFSVAARSTAGSGGSRVKRTPGSVDSFISGTPRARDKNKDPKTAGGDDDDIFGKKKGKKKKKKKKGKGSVELVEGSESDDDDENEDMYSDDEGMYSDGQVETTGRKTKDDVGSERDGGGGQETQGNITLGQQDAVGHHVE